MTSGLLPSGVATVDTLTESLIPIVLGTFINSRDSGASSTAPSGSFAPE